MKMLIFAVLALILSVGNLHAFAPHPPVITTNECGEEEITYPDLEGSKAPRYTKPSPPTFMERYDTWCREAPETYGYWLSIIIAGLLAAALYAYSCWRRKGSLKI